MVARAISSGIIPDISDKVGRKLILIISLILVNGCILIIPSGLMKPMVEASKQVQEEFAKGEEFSIPVSEITLKKGETGFIWFGVKNFENEEVYYTFSLEPLEEGLVFIDEPESNYHYYYFDKINMHYI